jgi:hypothetical protein
MNSLEIHWIYDNHECETCGSSTAEGARVLLNNEEILLLEPLAHCYDDISYSSEDVYKAILKHLGYSVKEIPPQT